MTQLQIVANGPQQGPFATIVDLGRLASKDGSPTFGLLAAALLVFYPHLAMSSANGLETSLFTALTQAGTLPFYGGWLKRRWDGRRQVVLALLFTLATATRPEGLILAAHFAGL